MPFRFSSDVWTVLRQFLRRAERILGPADDFRHAKRRAGESPLFPAHDWCRHHSMFMATFYTGSQRRYSSFVQLSTTVAVAISWGKNASALRHLKLNCSMSANCCVCGISVVEIHCLQITWPDIYLFYIFTLFDLLSFLTKRLRYFYAHFTMYCRNVIVFALTFVRFNHSPLTTWLSG